jgi:hypothetical protein
MACKDDMLKPQLGTELQQQVGLCCHAVRVPSLPTVAMLTVYNGP